VTPAAQALLRPRTPTPQPPALPVQLQGELLQPAELRVSGAGKVTVRLVLAQPDELPPICADYRPGGSPESSYVVWRQLVRDYTRGRMVTVHGSGLRLRTVNGRRALMLDHTDGVSLLQPPFDPRAAAAGEPTA